MRGRRRSGRPGSSSRGREASAAPEKEYRRCNRVFRPGQPGNKASVPGCRAKPRHRQSPQPQRRGRSALGASDTRRMRSMIVGSVGLSRAVRPAKVTPLLSKDHGNAGQTDQLGAKSYRPKFRLIPPVCTAGENLPA